MAVAWFATGCANDDDAIRVRDDVGFFQAVRTAIAKTSAMGRKAPDEEAATATVLQQAELLSDYWTETTRA